MVRNLEAALEWVRTEGLVTEIPAAGVPSLAEAVAGGPITGSVWRHGKGNLIYRLGRQLRASPEVLSLRLWEGKTTFVAPRLWPEIYRLVTEPKLRRPALTGLSPSARALLERVEREHEIRVPRHELEKERETLEARLLVQASDVQVDGEFWSRLRAWRSWASNAVVRIAEDLSYSDAVSGLASRNGTVPSGPWLPAPQDSPYR
jgi:hypothetical protein